MKIVVRHEGATDQEVEQTCVWAVGDDGETIATAYLKPGEQVDVNVGGVASIDAEFGTVGPIGEPSEEAAGEDPAHVDPETDQKAGERPGEGGGETAGAPGTPSGGQAGGEVAS